MVGLAEWFDANEIPVKFLDLDTENKVRGSLTHWFEKMHTEVSAAGIVFTAIGIITADPPSVESVLAWAAQPRIASSF